jgi:hypothetical protein
MKQLTREICMDKNQQALQQKKLVGRLIIDLQKKYQIGLGATSDFLQSMIGVNLVANKRRRHE